MGRAALVKCPADGVIGICFITDITGWSFQDWPLGLGKATAMYPVWVDVGLPVLACLPTAHNARPGTCKYPSRLTASSAD